MALKNLFLRRKAAQPTQAGDGPRAPDPPDAVAPDQGADPADQPAPLSPSHRQVKTRVRAQSLAADVPWEGRCSALLERLAMVLDPNEVVLSDGPREARIILSNRRLMVGRFRTGDGADQLFDFRHAPATDAEALACMQALAEMCRGSGDLLIGERPVTGVFAAEAGLALHDMVFDAAAYAAILRQRHGAEDDPGFGSAAKDQDSPPDQPAPVPLDPAAFPFAVLQHCRSFARDVLVQTRQGEAVLPSLPVPVSYRADLGPALQAWHAAVAPALGPELMVLLMPADPAERVGVLAVDGESAVAFGAARQSLGLVAKAARDLIVEG